ncbi:unnamed protein product [Cuscuta europaea]|uniref:Uncharacterized protein n=1 Tax=Cuscuta europaea TaxID=41803 RepID=A0A9P1E8R2_CUSEU|nr:unnamed protein product [Cuscuta europaea]
MVEDPHSVNSPRRILSFTKNKRATVVFPDSNQKASEFALPGDHGPNPSEVYGFVGSISTVVATDEFSREPLLSSAFIDDEDDERPIDPISDIGIDQINKIMFQNFD